MPIDLSTASDDGVKLILLRVPVMDLIRKCTQVSPQWNRILSDNDFWRKKMEQDGYQLEWTKFAGLSTESFKWMALKHCFERNFIKDSWNLVERSLTLDPRWKAGKNFLENSRLDTRTQIEIPPQFVDGQPEIPPGYDKPIPACISIHRFFDKKIVIKLADEGLTDEIMDKFRPTIVVSEMVANRRDCITLYATKCSLEANSDADQDEYWDSMMTGSVRKQFAQGEVECWHQVEHLCKDYPAGMRYLTMRRVGMGCAGHNPEGHCGLKLADCSVKALCEKNATE